MKIWFTDFWPSFYKVNFVVNSLREHGIDVTLSEDNPDLLFFSVFGKSHAAYNCPKVLISAECSTTQIKHGEFYTTFTHPVVKYDAVFSDFVISSQQPIHSRTLRFPTYAVHLDYIKFNNINTNYDHPKTNFCSFLAGHVSREGARYRALETIALYKKADVVENAFTRHLPPSLVNLVPHEENGDYIINKINFISSYKFVLGAEHTLVDDYISEKLADPMLVGAVPVYHGPDLNTEFAGGYVLPIDERLPDYLRYLDNKEDARKEIADTNYKIISSKLTGFQNDLVTFFKKHFL